MIQNRIAAAILDQMQGLLGEHPLAELIREIAAAGQSGALRLSRERAKVAIYFEAGELVFATSNLRPHRLREAVIRHGLPATQLEKFTQLSDDELASALIQSGQLKPETLVVIRGKQVSDVLMLALLWIDGTWEFDQRVRVADDLRVRVEVNRLLLECARHLPPGFVTARLRMTNSTYLRVASDNGTKLLPAEASVLSRAADSINLKDLTSLSGVGAEDSHRAVYALSLSGLLQRNNWPLALGPAKSSAPIKVSTAQRVAPVVAEIDEVADAEALFLRLDAAKDHYDVLDIGRGADSDEIKNAYHALARRFHPDRFHQNEPELRMRVESAFARIAQAYETLSDQSLRTSYDGRRRTMKPEVTGRKKSGTAGKPVPAEKSASAQRSPHHAKRTEPGPDANRAQASFQQGMDLLERKLNDEAIRFLAEAAMLAPREARYRAHYGHALIRQPTTRRMAETELQAALALDPDNSSYRVMLAELYKQLGLRRRAEGELQRALAADPKHEAARELLLSLKTNNQKS